MPGTDPWDGIFNDDHGTLRDESGQPLEYRVLHPDLPNIPLDESQVWPERFNDRQAEYYAGIVELGVTEMLGRVACRDEAGHLAWWLMDKKCPTCGAIV